MSEMTREEAIAILRDDASGASLWELAEAVDMAIEALEVRPYGEWIWQTEDKYRCSVCGKNTRVEEVMNEPQYNFCPFCGADMREKGR